jgi:hypothetical protein
MIRMMKGTDFGPYVKSDDEGYVKSDDEGYGL